MRSKWAEAKSWARCARGRWPRQWGCDGAVGLLAASRVHADGAVRLVPQCPLKGAPLGRRTVLEPRRGRGAARCAGPREPGAHRRCRLASHAGGAQPLPSPRRRARERPNPPPSLWAWPAWQGVRRVRSAGPAAGAAGAAARRRSHLKVHDDELSVGLPLRRRGIVAFDAQKCLWPPANQTRGRVSCGQRGVTARPAPRRRAPLAG